MMSKKRTPHTETELIKIFNQSKIDEKYFPKFIGYYNDCFKELLEDHKDWNDDDWEDGGSVQASALWCMNNYINKYLKFVNQGHGEEWSHILAHTSEDGQRAILYVYNVLKKSNPVLAKKEILTYAKSLSDDEDFQNHYIYLIEEGAKPNNLIERAKKYAHLYKAEIEKGNSEVYAQEYAHLMAGGVYHEIYCEDYAYSYEEAIKESKDEEYARLYAEKYASALVDIKRRYGISDNEEMMEFAIERVNAYMNAWVYANKNRLSDFKRFADIYEHIHLNTYFADEGRPYQSDVEIDKYILNRALEEFGK
jgi:hypothetical protein